METLVLPNFIICSDIRRSVCLIYWSFDGTQMKLSIQADSFRNHTLYTTEFFDSNQESLRIVTADDEKNVCLLSYQVHSITLCIIVMWIARKLDKVADFNTGCLISKFRRHKLPEKHENLLLFCNNEGGLGFMISYDQAKYKALSIL